MALRLIFTVCRTNEIVGAKWTEIERTFPTAPCGRPRRLHEDGTITSSRRFLSRARLAHELSKASRAT